MGSARRNDARSRPPPRLKRRAGEGRREAGSRSTFGGRAGGISASFSKAPPRPRPALPAPGGGARGTRAGGRPLFPGESPPRGGFPSVGAAGRESGAHGQRGASRFWKQRKASRAVLIAASEKNPRIWNVRDIIFSSEVEVVLGKPAPGMSGGCLVGCGGVRNGNPRSLCTFKKSLYFSDIGREQETVAAVIPERP